LHEFGMAAELLEFALERARSESGKDRRQSELLSGAATGGDGTSAPEACGAQGQRRVHAIEGLISPQLGIGPDELSFAFEVLSKGTEAEGARLDFTVSPTAIRCPSCGAHTAAKDGETDAAMPCPVCGAEAKIEAVRGLEVTGFETGLGWGARQEGGEHEKNARKKQSGTGGIDGPRDDG